MSRRKKPSRGIFASFKHFAAYIMAGAMAIAIAGVLISSWQVNNGQITFINRAAEKQNLMRPYPNPAPAPASRIYYDWPPSNGWEISYVDGHYNLRDTAYAYNGNHSIGMSIWPYGLLTFGNWNFTSYNRYHKVVFYINGGKDSNHDIKISLEGRTQILDMRPLNPYIEGGSIQANTWRRVVVPFGDFRPANQSYDHVSIRNMTPQIQQRFYIDHVKLICVGDANDDDIINESDMVIFEAEEGVCSYGCRADFNRNGSVDQNDYMILKDNLGTTCQ